jgi:hypothetical protein
MRACVSVCVSAGRACPGTVSEKKIASVRLCAAGRPEGNEPLSSELLKTRFRTRRREHTCTSSIECQTGICLGILDLEVGIPALGHTQRRRPTRSGRGVPVATVFLQCTGCPCAGLYSTSCSEVLLCKISGHVENPCLNTARRQRHTHTHTLAVRGPRAACCLQAFTAHNSSHSIVPVN